MDYFKIHNSKFIITRRVGVIVLTLFLLFHPARVFSQSKLAPTEHSPRHALVLSAILPGSGQIYNKQAWKVPIIYTALIGTGYLTYSNHKQMMYYRNEYLYRRSNNDMTQYPDDPDMVATPTSNIYNMYETYNKYFQLSLIVSAAFYSLNLIDAYVFGHLFDFQIDDNLTLYMSPSVMPSGGIVGFGQSPFLPAASISLRF